MTLVESLIIDLRRLHDALDRSLDGVSSEQLHMVPAGHPKANTIAWTVWHYARTEDNVVRFVLQNRRPTVWIEGGYAERLDLPPVAQGTGMPTAEAQTLRIKDVALFGDYMKKVWASTDAYVQGLTPTELDRKIALKFVGELPVARVLAQVCVTHGFTHLGEIELTRALVGAAPAGGG